MKLCIPLIACALLVASCGDDEPGAGIGRASFDGLADEPLACPWRVHEVFPVGASGQFVELVQDTAELPLEGLPSGTSWALCASQACLAFEPPVASRERVLLLPETTVFELGRPGELSLYADQALVGEPRALCSFVAWGADPGATEGSQVGAAVTAGVWTVGDFVPTDGSSLDALVATELAPTSAAGWGCGVPTPGAEPSNIDTCN